MATRYFDPEYWATGSYYDLYVAFGPGPVERFEAALAALWSHPDLDGPYGDNTVEPSDQEKVSANEGVCDANWTPDLYGVATLPDGNKLACGSLVRWWKGAPEGLDFYISMNVLETVYPVEYPQDESWDAWAGPLDDWLLDLARWVFQAVPFLAATVGEEVGSDLDAQLESGLQERWMGVLAPAANGELRWLPANVELGGD
jgi:hypothetical protein